MKTTSLDTLLTDIRACRLCVLAVGKAVCSECGPVTLQPEHMQQLAPDGDWLRRRMAQALGLAAAPPWPVVSGQARGLGDIGHASARRRILYGER